MRCDWFATIVSTRNIGTMEISSKLNTILWSGSIVYNFVLSRLQKWALVPLHWNLHPLTINCNYLGNIIILLCTGAPLVVVLLFVMLGFEFFRPIQSCGLCRSTSSSFKSNPGIIVHRILIWYMASHCRECITIIG